MKLLPAAGVALALFGGSALAGDLPSTKAAPIFTPPPTPAFAWNGAYGGVNIGYGFSDGSAESGAMTYASPHIEADRFWSGGNDINGVVGGGQIGYNYEISPMLVLGVESDFHGTDMTAQRNFAGLAVGDSATSTKKLDWFGSVRGRVGVTLPTAPNILVYGTGGFAYGQLSHSFSVVDAWPDTIVIGRGSYSNTATGWTAGGGSEWAPGSFPSWSMKVEYLYTDLGSTNVNVIGAFAAPAPMSPFYAQTNSPTRFHTVRAGLNWHFNPSATVPVLAKF